MGRCLAVCRCIMARAAGRAGIDGRGPPVRGVDSHMARRHGLIGANKQWGTAGGIECARMEMDFEVTSLSVAIVAASESGAVACPTINHLLALDQCNVTRGRPEGFAVRLASSGRRTNRRRRVSFEFFPALASRCFFFI